MASVIETEHENLKKKTQEKAGKVFEILKEEGLFARQFSDFSRVLNELFQSRKSREHQETGWHIKRGRWHWWDTILLSWRRNAAMIISLSTNTVTFMVYSDSNLLQQIRSIAEQISKDTSFETKIIKF